MTDGLIKEIDAMSIDELYDLADYITSVKKKKRREQRREEAREENREEINRKNNNNHTRARTRGRFVPPTVDEVAAYCRGRNNKVDPVWFFSYYEANGWRVGKVTMKNWRAAVHTWERNAAARAAERAAERKAREKRSYRSSGWTPPPISNEYKEAQLAELRKAGLI